MKITARDIMTTTFHTLSPTTPIDQAVRLFRQATIEENRNIFGMMVLDEEGLLAGILSMYDILMYMRPKHTQIWGMMDDIDTEELVDIACDQTQSIQVGDLMTPDVITVSPNTHKFMILDLMINKHIRRLPVVENDKVLGIVYISNLFYDVFDRFTD